MAVVTRRRENTRARLLEAAHEVFGEVGLGGASVEAICERAGFTRGAFYSNFESKDELFLALTTQLADEKLDEVAVRVQDLGPTIDPESVVHEVIGASFAEGLEPQLMAEIRVQAIRDPRLAEAYLAWQTVLRGRVETIMRTVVDRFDLTLRMDVTDAAQLLLDISEQTTTRGALERRSRAEVSEQLTARLVQVVALLLG